MWVGPPGSALGVCEPDQHRCCDRLKCSLCDMHVVRLPNSRWTKSVDYVFIRTQCAPSACPPARHQHVSLALSLALAVSHSLSPCPWQLTVCCRHAATRTYRSWQSERCKMSTVPHTVANAPPSRYEKLSSWYRGGSPGGDVLVTLPLPFQVS